MLPVLLKIMVVKSAMPLPPDLRNVPALLNVALPLPPVQADTSTATSKVAPGKLLITMPPPTHKVPPPVPLKLAAPALLRGDYSRYFQLKDMVAKPAALGKGFLAKK
jgi:hypothetical protein